MNVKENPVWVKICGLRDPQTLAGAASAGADFIGLVFVAGSPRWISVEAAAALLSAVPTAAARRTGLVADMGDAELDALLARVPLDYLQLHGQETPERTAAIRARYGLPIIKAVGVASATDVRAAAAYTAADMLLLDAKADSGLHGGNNRVFDWGILDSARPQKPWFLAGGLNPGNVATAIEQSRPDGVDVSSGVEATRGVKDAGLIQQFIEKVRKK